MATSTCQMDIIGKEIICTRYGLVGHKRPRFLLLKCHGEWSTMVTRYLELVPSNDYAPFKPRENSAGHSLDMQWRPTILTCSIPCRLTDVRHMSMPMATSGATYCNYYLQRTESAKHGRSYYTVGIVATRIPRRYERPVYLRHSSQYPVIYSFI